MSQQINLLNPAFHKTFDWLTATPLAIATCATLVVLGAASAWATMQADGRERTANQRAELLKAAQEKLLTMSKLVAESKPDAQMASELASARALIRSREEVVKVLEGGAIGSTIGFAEFLRGFSRQTPTGLWLTGFTIGAGGSEMEIRGRMLNPSSLPEYIRRLKTENVFQGRSFASLTIQRPEEGKEKKTATTPLASPVKPGGSTAALAPTLPPSFVDFVLMPNVPEAVKGVNDPVIGQAQLLPRPDAVPMPNVFATVKGVNDLTSQAQLLSIPEKKP